MRAFVYCDGEEAQIRVLQEPDILSQLSDTLIDLGKSPASCSAKHQASDVSSWFKVSKKKQKTLTPEEYRNDVLKGRINTVLANTGLSSDKRKKALFGLLSLVYTFKVTLNPAIVAHGYEKCGQSPIDFKKIINQCTKKPTIDELKKMELALPSMISCFQANGHITEQAFNEADIVSNSNEQSNKRPKDERALQCQRACLMTHVDSVARYIDYIAVRNAAPRIAEEKKQAAKVQKEAIERLKKNEKLEKEKVAADKKEEKRKELEHYNKLTYKEKVAYNKEKREKQKSAT